MGYTAGDRLGLPVPVPVPVGMHSPPLHDANPQVENTTGCWTRSYHLPIGNHRITLLDCIRKLHIIYISMPLEVIYVVRHGVSHSRPIT